MPHPKRGLGLPLQVVKSSCNFFPQPMDTGSADPLHLLSQFALSGSRGGLLLSWRLGVVLECFVLSKNHIYAWCYSDPPNHPWILSYVYGPLARRDKPAFWDSFTSVGENFASP